MTKAALKWIGVVALLGIFSSIGATSQGISAELPATDIKSPRTGSVRLTLQNADGTMIKNATVNYAQTTHDFLFGVGMSGPRGVFPYELYSDFAKMGVNYILPLFLWAGVEPEPGDYRWNGVKKYRIPDLKQLGFTIHGHLLIFFFDYSWCIPEYIKTMGFDELHQAVYKHVFDVVQQYRGEVAYWTINEPGDPRSSYFKFTQDQWVEIVRSAGRAIRDADPNAKIFINIVVDDHDGYSPHQFLDALVDRGVEFDAIGLEMYPGFVPSDENGYPGIDASQERILSFVRFGKPIIITEIAIPEVPSREAQANWFRSFYTMAFEISAVKGIVWYYVVDDPNFPPAATAGLFPNLDYVPPTPRLIYQALADLIRERTTSGITHSDSNGIVSIEGYAGNYQVAINDNAQDYSLLIHIAEGENRSIIFSVPTATPTPSPTQTSTPTLSPTQTPTPTFSPTTTIIPGLVNQDSSWIVYVFVGVLSIVLVFGIGRLIKLQRKQGKD